MTVSITLEKPVEPLKGSMQVIKLKNASRNPIKLLDIYVEETLNRFKIEFGNIRGKVLTPNEEVEVLLTCITEASQIYEVLNILDIKVDYV